LLRYSFDVSVKTRSVVSQILCLSACIFTDVRMGKDENNKV